MFKQGRWSIKHFLLAGSVSIFVLLAADILMTHYVANTKLALFELESKVAISSNTLLMIRRHEKDFLSRHNTKYIELIQTEKEDLEQQLTEINKLLIKSDLDIIYDNHQTLKQLDSYVDNLALLTDEVLSIRGTGDAVGFAMALEQHSSQLQSEANRLKAPQLVDLMIDNQQDIFNFFARHDTLLLPNIAEQFSNIEQNIKNQTQASGSLLQAFLAFEQAFYRLQASSERRGYSESLGYHGELRQSVHDIEGSLNMLFGSIPTKVEASVSALVMTQAMVEGTLTLFIILILFYIYYAITRMESGLITARVKEERANKAKSSFLANMSHEIRTPLNGIIGMTEILTDSKLSAIQKDYLATINSSSQTLLMLINDILDLSKIESGHLEISPHTCAIKEVIYDTAALIAPKAQQKSIALRISIDSNIPSYIRADEQKLRQIMMNLASNAIKFTASGSVTFKLQIETQTEQTIGLLFSVKDTGVGIDESKHKQIFEEFQQEDSNTSVEFGGTGLGLSISTRMVKMMGGEIAINSSKGVGSEFFFSLRFARQTEGERGAQPVSQHLIYCARQHSPLLIQNIIGLHHQLDKTHQVDEIVPLITPTSVLVFNAEDIKDKQAFVASVADFSGTPILISRSNNTEKDDFGELVAGYITIPLLGMRLDTLIKSVAHRHESKDILPPIKEERDDNKMVLVVEDNKVNQQVVAINLKKLKMPHLIANDGKEALEHYKRHIGNFSVILMDCMMPVMDGFEATKAIRLFEQEEDAKRVRIIALTASILDDDIQKCFDSGMDDYLPKPFKREVLVDKLAKLH
ncbi:response regulator [Shewanella sp. KX20019]|uniref:hybrid sensor histidine kinase/response regulator n=1 Tax=Shewanella sp. KX20019 TaxID=2803864 RepID=UPI001925BCDB|nr:ATP-binding protein [Shewanella sp. KX20019]QQX81328.1 response regulator [Shewanella sp. KX20019]